MIPVNSCIILLECILQWLKSSCEKKGNVYPVEWKKEKWTVGYCMSSCHDKIVTQQCPYRVKIVSTVVISLSMSIKGQPIFIEKIMQQVEKHSYITNLAICEPFSFTAAWLVHLIKLAQEHPHQNGCYHNMMWPLYNCAIVFMLRLEGKWGNPVSLEGVHHT